MADFLKDESPELRESLTKLVERAFGENRKDDSVLIGVNVQVVRLVDEGNNVSVATAFLIRECGDDDQSMSHKVKHEVLIAEDCLKALDDKRLEAMERYVTLCRAERTPTTEGH